jgi:hypothetical protein
VLDDLPLEIADVDFIGLSKIAALDNAQRSLIDTQFGKLVSDSFDKGLKRVGVGAVSMSIEPGHCLDIGP